MDSTISDMKVINKLSNNKFQLNNSISIEVVHLNELIMINIQTIDVIFEKFYTYNDLIRISSFFNIYKNLTSIHIFLLKIIQKENFKLLFDNSKLELILEVTIEDDIKEVTFELDAKGDIEFLFNKLLKQRQTCRDEISKLKSEASNLYKTIEYINDDNVRDVVTVTSTILQKQDEVLIKLWLQKPSQMKLIYKSSKHGSSSTNFHMNCDNQGPTLILIQTIDMFKFGGYSAKSWESDSGYLTDSQCFLFSLNRRRKINNNGNDSIYSNKQFGPIFGRGHDLLVSSNFDENYESYSSIGHCYGKNEDISPYSSETFLAGKRNFKIKELEVFKIIFE
jgi:hypothetical protein